MLHNDYAEVGGEYFSVRAEVESLRNRNVDVEFITVDNAKILEERGRRGFLMETIRPRIAPGLLDTALRRFKPHLVHAQNLFPLMGGAAIDTMQEHRVPWVRTLRNYRLRCVAGTCFRDGQNCFDCKSSAQGYPGILHGCYRNSVPASAVAVGHAIREQAARISHPPAGNILLSESMRALLANVLGDTPTYVKPNSVAGDLARNPIPRRNRRPEFLYVGRLSAEKGLSPLITSFARNPDLRLVVIGEGTLDDKDQSLLETSPNINLIGAIPPEEVVRRMREALAVIVPSAWAEPFGRVAAESLAAGTPALVSNVGGLTDIVAGLGDHALLVEPGEDWAARARDLANLGSDIFDQLAASCLNKWASNYEDGAVGDRLLEIYTSVLGADWTQTS
ncbi:glycosyltransferase [Microbacterium sp. NPDC089189]|uniref:glycosyltransferase n=1 Tax=Microbacterium sp. NPDC089189 TaxID=3154972 RepID=UPI003428673D